MLRSGFVHALKSKRELWYLTPNKTVYLLLRSKRGYEDYEVLNTDHIGPIYEEYKTPEVVSMAYFIQEE